MSVTLKRIKASSCCCRKVLLRTVGVVPWISLKPFLEHPMPSEVVTEHPSSAPTGHKQEFMLRVSTRSVNVRNESRQSGHPLYDHVNSCVEPQADRCTPVVTSYLETSTAQAPQPPSAQAILVPCANEGKLGRGFTRHEGVANEQANRAQGSGYLEVCFSLDDRVQVLSEILLDDKFDTVDREPHAVLIRGLPGSGPRHVLPPINHVSSVLNQDLDPIRVWSAICSLICAIATFTSLPNKFRKIRICIGVFFFICRSSA